MADDSVAAELCHRLGSPFYPAALRIPSRHDVDGELKRFGSRWLLGTCLDGFQGGEKNQERYFLKAALGCMTVTTLVLAYCEQLSRHRPSSCLCFAAVFHFGSCYGSAM